MPSSTPLNTQDQKSITISFMQEPDNLNPMYTSGYDTTIARDLYLHGAWNFDADLNPHPILVTEIPRHDNWGISEDGLVITLYLREDIVWSDGEELNAADFLFTYEMIMSDRNNPSSRFPYDEFVEVVEIVDDLTVQVTLTKPYAEWLSTLFSYVLPEHVLRPVFEAESTIDRAEWNRAPRVTNGPFVFDGS